MHFATPARVFPSIAAAAAILAAGFAAAQPGERRIDQVREAYDTLDAYHADCTFEIVQRNGDWTNRRRATLVVAYDPSDRRLMVDDPEVLIVVVDDTLRARLHDQPGRYVEHDLPEGWRWSDLTVAAPVLVARPLPDVAMLVDDTPIGALSSGFNERATPLTPEPDDPQRRPRLQFHTQEGVFTLAIDPATQLLDGAVFERADLPPGMALADTYAWTVHPTASPMPDELFAFDTTGAVQVTTFSQLPGPGTGGGGQPAPPPPAIEPGDALAVELATLDGEAIKLADTDVSTLVLSFVTTWAVGGADTVTAVSAAARRAEAENADAAFFVVDVYEDAGLVRQTFEPLEVDVPILIDPEGVLAEAVQAFLVPTTVVIRDGKVVESFPANTPDLADRLVAIAAERQRPADDTPGEQPADPPESTP
ncbi:MAG: redoxin domain-containing protein [Planctomycetota bacterium]